MQRTTFRTAALELALQTAGHQFPRLSLVGVPRAETGPALREGKLRLPAPGVSAPAFFLLDVTMTADGKIHLIEANGSNAALSSSSPPHDQDRAGHMAFAFRQKPRPDGPVTVLLCHQANFIHIAEFYERAGTFAEHISQDHAVALRGDCEELGPEDVSVVCGPIHNIAALVEARGRALFYRGRPVVFACNPNLLPELVRRGTVNRDGVGYEVDDSIFHEGRCTPIVHDKGLQQDLARGTAITPLLWREAHDRAGWLEAAQWFRARNIVCVAKMNSGSGGAGIQVVTPAMSDAQTSMALDRIVANARDKHGAAADATVYPVRLFEFAMGRPYLCDGLPHLWDMRLQCLVWPGRVDVRPCIIRLCPQPFNGSYSWDSCVSNLTGRDAAKAMQFLRAPHELRRSMPGSVTAGLGLDEATMRSILRGCGEWSIAAARWATIR